MEYECITVSKISSRFPRWDNAKREGHHSFGLRFHYTMHEALVARVIGSVGVLEIFVPNALRLIGFQASVLSQEAYHRIFNA